MPEGLVLLLELPEPLLAVTRVLDVPVDIPFLPLLPGLGRPSCLAGRDALRILRQLDLQPLDVLLLLAEFLLHLLALHYCLVVPHLQVFQSTLLLFVLTPVELSLL